MIYWRNSIDSTKQRRKKKHEWPHGTLSISDAAAKYGIDRRKLARWLRCGLPALIGPGRLVLIRERDLQHWLAIDKCVQRESSTSEKTELRRLARESDIAAEYREVWRYRQA